MKKELIPLIQELEKLLSPTQVKTDPALLQQYGQDWTRIYSPSPSAVVFPGSTEDVKKIVQFARSHSCSIVPSGGRTGLSGGAVATQGEIVVSFEKMNQILEFNETDLTVTCQPGVITQDLQEYILEKGYFFPVDFAARGSSQIGGNVSTNAGGINVLRYGSMRNWVCGLEVVTGKGEILSLNQKLKKNATGYDLRHLLIGSEGTLGLITRVDLNFTRKPQDTQVLLLSVDKMESLISIFQKFQKDFSLLAFEFFTRSALEKVISKMSLKDPFRESSPFYVLVEIENSPPDALPLLECFENCLKENLLSDGVISQNYRQSKEIWALRENITEAISGDHPHKNDISIPISKVTSFLEELEALLKNKYAAYEVLWYGHLGDGNLHVNILKPQSVKVKEFEKDCKKVDPLLFELVQKYQGSISAEHGIGLTKKPFLHFSRSPEEIEIMKSIKSIFDPDGILNPGKVF